MKRCHYRSRKEMRLLVPSQSHPLGCICGDATFAQCKMCNFLPHKEPLKEEHKDSGGDTSVQC